MKIREYKEEDYADVRKVWSRCFPKLRPIDSKAVMKRIAKHAPGLFLVAVKENSIVGTVYASYDGRQAIVHRLAVLPVERGNGVGTKLLKRLFIKLERLKPIEILVHANPDRHVIKIFECFGLKKSHSIYMKKELY